MQSEEAVKRATSAVYRKTRDEAIPVVKCLIIGLLGKTVVTADHGEMLKDRLSPFLSVDYDHDSGLYVPEHITVPWFDGEYDERKWTTAEVPDPTDTTMRQ